MASCIVIALEQNGQGQVIRLLYFYAPGLKGLPGHLVNRLSVHLFVRPAYR